MKILLTSVGRRCELLQAFRDAANRLNLPLTIYGADIASDAPGLVFCDKAVLCPKISDASYIPFLVDFCEKNAIDALIPTIDTDLLLLAQNQSRFLHTKVLISSEEVISICRDKRVSTDFLNGIGLKSPKAVDDYASYEGGFPAFIKPLNGSSAINAFRINSEEELAFYAQIVPGYIIQPYIGGTEYTVDVFCDFAGNPILITPRIRLAIRGGEVLKTQISQDEKIISEVQRIVEVMRPCGQITVQLIRDAEGNDWFIEINPRFGGGAPLSIKAGADSCEMLLRLLEGEKLSYMENAAEDGAVFSRFDQSVRVR